MNIKLIVTDLDGTLLHEDKTISEYTLSILEKCRAKGIKVVPATARGHVVSSLSNLIDGLVSNNGATAYAGDTLIHSRIMTIDAVRDFLVTVAGMGVNILAQSRDGSFYANFNLKKTWAKGWITPYKSVDFSTIDIELKYLFAIADTEEESKRAEQIINEYLPSNLCLLVRDKGRLMVVLHNEAMKSKGVAALAKHWGIMQSEIVAFGDDTIDIDLLEYCGVGVAVSNALDEVKAIANHICDSNDNDGVAKWLEQHIA